MNRILQLSADEQNSISSGIIKYVLVNRAKNNTGMNIDDSVYITEYLDSRINSWGIYLILLKGEEVLYNNLSFELSDIGSIDYAGKATWRVQEIEDQPYLVILSRIPLSDENLWNIYVRNISDIYADRKGQYTLFIQLGLVVTVILSVGLIFITGHLTRSLRLLTEAVQRRAGATIRSGSISKQRMKRGLWRTVITKWLRPLKRPYRSWRTKQKSSRDLSIISRMNCGRL